MKPFSSFYYVKNNSKRTIRIIIIIGLLALCYLGGVYLDNIKTETIAVIDHQSSFVTVNASYRDENGQQYRAFLEEVKNNNSIEYFQIGFNYVAHRTMLGFLNKNTAYTFTKEDFSRFNSYMNYVDQAFIPKDNMIIVSKKQGNALKVTIGDTISSDNEFINAYYGGDYYEVGPLMDVDAFISYFITSDSTDSASILILPNPIYPEQEYKQFILSIKNKYDKLQIIDYEELLKNAKTNFQINDIFFIASILLLSIVFIITTNAAFVGLYDRRISEFELYHSLGIPKSTIRKKVIGEILLMNGMGILLCIAICITTIFFLNFFIFEPDGLRLRYYAPIALSATVISNIVILGICILLRLRTISKLKMAT
ncbi:ABC-type lipoprotein release transport system permease subunit [Natranaerovirga pectinivora]|uniref:ABC-type lipoprotein release transport system permease subunit n=1 Tax=Natranaerovirga pectinivora TaxID=682400 RepID=A0A4R3MP55_9FIRM|nr:ABC transporter permease [Natranaerovirga pectinivora]TCT16041.1 ABC-type lipoprotein release transport system permease subunit [Natranaerovirga pectinivora]